MTTKYMQDCLADAQRAHVRAAMESLVAEVLRYAAAHYDGWDIIVESYSADDIAAIIKSARTVSGAIRKVRYESAARKLPGL